MTKALAYLKDDRPSVPGAAGAYRRQPVDGRLPKRHSSSATTATATTAVQRRLLRRPSADHGSRPASRTRSTCPTCVGSTLAAAESAPCWQPLSCEDRLQAGARPGSGSGSSSARSRRRGTLSSYRQVTARAAEGPARGRAEARRADRRAREGEGLAKLKVHVTGHRAVGGEASSRRRPAAGVARPGACDSSLTLAAAKRTGG